MYQRKRIQNVPVHVFVILLIGHFRIVFCLWVKMSLLAKLALLYKHQ